MRHRSRLLRYNAVPRAQARAIALKRDALVQRITLLSAGASFLLMLALKL